MYTVLAAVRRVFFNRDLLVAWRALVVYGSLATTTTNLSTRRRRG